MDALPGGAALPNDLRGLTDTLVVANEWLDVVPCTISQMDADARLREVNTYANGREALAGPRWRTWPGSASGGPAPSNTPFRAAASRSGQRATPRGRTW